MIALGFVVGLMVVTLVGLVLFFRIKNSLPEKRFKREFGIGMDDEYILLKRAVQIRLEELDKDLRSVSTSLDSTRNSTNGLLYIEDVRKKSEEIKSLQLEASIARKRYKEARKIAVSCQHLEEEGVKFIEQSMRNHLLAV